MARITLVDDDEQVRAVLGLALRESGHDVLEARDGRDALKLLRAGPADLLITDIFLPERDGIELIMTMRREQPELKIIAMSGGGVFRQVEPLQTAEALGAFATLEKPVNVNWLLGVVEKALAA